MSARSGTDELRGERVCGRERCCTTATSPSTRRTRSSTSWGAWPGREHATAALEVALGFDQLEELDVVVRDLERGLIDFPSLLGGEEIYLCWLLDEPEVGHWHAPESGFGGRRPL